MTLSYCVAVFTLYMEKQPCHLVERLKARLKLFLRQVTCFKQLYIYYGIYSRKQVRLFTVSETLLNKTIFYSANILKGNTNQVCFQPDNFCEITLKVICLSLWHFRNLELLFCFLLLIVSSGWLKYRGKPEKPSVWKNEKA